MATTAIRPGTFGLLAESCGGVTGTSAAASGGGSFRFSIPRDISDAATRDHTAPLLFDRYPDHSLVRAYEQADRFTREFTGTLQDYIELTVLTKQIHNGETPEAFNSLSPTVRQMLFALTRNGRTEAQTIDAIEHDPKELLPGIMRCREALETRLNLRGTTVVPAEIGRDFDRTTLTTNLSDVAEIENIKRSLRGIKEALIESDGITYKGVDFLKLFDSYKSLPDFLRNYLKKLSYEASQANTHDVGMGFGNAVLDDRGAILLTFLRNRTDSVIDQLITHYDSYPIAALKSSAATTMDIAMRSLSSFKEPRPWIKRHATVVRQEAQNEALMAKKLHELKKACQTSGIYVHETRAQELIRELEVLGRTSGNPYITSFFKGVFDPRSGEGDLYDVSLLNRMFSFDSIDSATEEPVIRLGIDVLIEYAESVALLSAMELTLTSESSSELDALARDCSNDAIPLAIAQMKRRLETPITLMEKERMRRKVIDLRVALNLMFERGLQHIRKDFRSDEMGAVERIHMGLMPSIEDVCKEMDIALSPSAKQDGSKWKVLVTTIENAAYSVGGLGPAVHGATEAMPKSRYDAVILTPFHNKINPDLKTQVEAAVDNYKRGTRTEGVEISEVTHNFCDADHTDYLIRIPFRGATYLFHYENAHTFGGIEGRSLYHVEDGKTFYTSGGHEGETLRMAYFSSAVAKVAMRRFEDGTMYDNVVINDSHSAAALRIIKAEKFQDFRMGLTPAFTFMVHNNGFHVKLPSSLTRDQGEGWRNLHEYAVRESDTVATVSPAHAHELLTEEHGNGIDGVFLDRAIKKSFFGILNGIETHKHSPSEDAVLRSRRIVDLDARTNEEMPKAILDFSGALKSLSLNPKGGRADTLLRQLNAVLAIDTRTYLEPINPDLRTNLETLKGRLEAKIALGETDIDDVAGDIRELSSELDTFVVANTLAFSKSDPRIVAKKRIAKQRLQEIYRDHYQGKAGMPGSEAQISFFDPAGKERPVMYYVGRYDAKQKGLQRFKEALEAAKEKGAVLIVMGTPEEGEYAGRSATSYLDELEALANGNADATSWGGAWVIREDKKQPGEESQRFPYQMGSGGRPGVGNMIRAAADFLYSPSNYEPCGLTPPEAMLKGAALAVTDTGGFIDWVRQAGTGSATLRRDDHHREDLEALLGGWYDLRENESGRTAQCQRMVDIGAQADWQNAIVHYELLLAIARKRRHLRDLRIAPPIGADTIREVLAAAAGLPVEA